MALEIRENRGLFEVRGKVTSQNIDALRAYFMNTMEKQDAFVISIEKVTEMDISGAKMFEELYKQSAEHNKYIAIIGEENNCIKEVMAITNTDYILNADRV